ncbi:MAG: MFS transporter, partial [Pseudomonadota bacterium]
VMSRAEGLMDSLLGFSLLAGLGLGLGFFLPTQTLGTNWFLRYRATALAILMTAGGVIGKFVPSFGADMAADAGWRQVWVVVSACSIGVALLALILVRNTPESIGLLPDWRSENTIETGERSTAAEAQHATADATSLDPDWEPKAALRTPHFIALTFCAIAFATPWGVAVAHGSLHLTDLDFSETTVGAVMGWMILVSIFGRLSGLVGDWIPPQRALAIALALEALGTIGFLWAPSPNVALASAIALGLGFGAAYVCVAATFGAFFGRRAFSVTMGTRMALTGLINAAMPVIAGRFFDQTGSYTIPFVALGVITFTGAIIAWVLKAPVPPKPVPSTSSPTTAQIPPST